MTQESGRIVVTGLGVVSPFGIGVSAFWQGLMAAHCAINVFDLFDATRHRTQIAAQAPLADRVTARARRARWSRSDHFAVLAAEEAIAEAGLPASDNLRRCGVFFGSSTGGMLEGERYYEELRRSGPLRARASRIAAQPTGTPAEAVARELRLRGPVETSAAACSASTMALEAAWFALRSGTVDLALAGGADALCELTYGGFNALRAVDERPARPFRQERAGLSLGEGAGVLVLEREEYALQRGALPLAELAGAASACDAYHMTAPDPTGGGALLALRQALESAGLAPEQVAFVNAHGTGTPHNDAAESAALQQLFGSARPAVPVAATKALVGHLLGACGGLEAIATVLCLRAANVHAIPASGLVDPALGIDVVLGEPRKLHAVRAALSLNLAFGGANAALVFRPVAAAGRPR